MEAAKPGTLAAQPVSLSFHMGDAVFVLPKPWEELTSHDEAHRQPLAGDAHCVTAYDATVSLTDANWVRAYVPDLCCHACCAVKNKIDGCKVERQRSQLLTEPKRRYKFVQGSNIEQLQRLAKVPR